MDPQTYNTLKSRIEWLELQMNNDPKGESTIPSINIQLAALQSNLGKLLIENPEFNQLYQHLNDLGLWKQVKNKWSEVDQIEFSKDNESEIEEAIHSRTQFSSSPNDFTIDMKKEVLLSMYSKIMNTISDLNQLSSYNISTLLEVDVGILTSEKKLELYSDEIQTILKNLNALSIKSIATLEKFSQYFIDSNDFWSTCEERLLQIQKKVAAKEQTNSSAF